MLKVRVKGPSERKQKCHKSSCTGTENQQENYLSVTSRNASPKHKKSKSKKKHTKTNHLQLILQESYTQIKAENESLQRKLAIKKKKVEEIKEKLHNCEIKLAVVER